MARTLQRLKNQVEHFLEKHFRIYGAHSLAVGGSAFSEAVEGILSILHPDRDLSLQQQMVGALCEVMGLDSALNGERVARLATALLRADERYTPDLIRREYGEGGGYYEHHWKGQRGDRPGEQEIRATILLAAQGWPAVAPNRRGSRSPV